MDYVAKLGVMQVPARGGGGVFMSVLAGGCGMAAAGDYTVAADLRWEGTSFFEGGL